MSGSRPDLRRAVAFLLGALAASLGAASLAVGANTLASVALLLAGLAGLARVADRAVLAAGLGGLGAVLALAAAGDAPVAAVAIAVSAVAVSVSGKRLGAWAGCLCALAGFVTCEAHLTGVRASSELGRLVAADPLLSPGVLSLGVALLLRAVPVRLPREVRVASLRRNALALSVGAPMLFALLGASAAVLPLYARLDEAEHARLEEAADSRARAVGALLGRIRSQAELIASRSHARHLLEMLEQGVGFESITVEDTADILNEARRSTPEILGITRYRKDGSELVSVGLRFDAALAAPLAFTELESTVSGPHLVSGAVCFLGSAAILTLEGQRIGTDLVLVSAGPISAALGEATELGSTWALSIESREESGTRVFAAGHAGLAPAAAFGGEGGELVLARAEVPDYEFSVVVGLERAELESRVRGELARIAVLLAFLGAAVFCTAILILRPLASGVLVHSEGLEREVAAKTVELLARTAELERSNHDLEQFAYAASHDLQEPLKLIGGFAQLLEKRYADRLGADGREFLGYLHGGAERMQHLVRDLLAYSRVGRGDETVEPVDWGALLDEVEELYAEELRATGATVSRGELPVTRGVPALCRQLLQNLVGNALKYRSKESPRIEVSARAADGGFEFEVRDNGIGIEPRHSERIFDVFERLHGREEYPGTGIGLALCKRIVERAGGRIWVESEPGRGSTFRFTLPGEAGAGSQSG